MGVSGVPKPKGRSTGAELDDPARLASLLQQIADGGWRDVSPEQRTAMHARLAQSIHSEGGRAALELSRALAAAEEGGLRLESAATFESAVARCLTHGSQESLDALTRAGRVTQLELQQKLGSGELERPLGHRVAFWICLALFLAAAAVLITVGELVSVGLLTAAFPTLLKACVIAGVAGLSGTVALAVTMPDDRTDEARELVGQLEPQLRHLEELAAGREHIDGLELPADSAMAAAGPATPATLRAAKEPVAGFSLRRSGLKTT